MTEYDPHWVRTTDRRFGARVRVTRERLNLSQQELADRVRQRHGLNWHQSTVTKLEAGTRPTRLIEALAVADVLGRDLVDLLDRPREDDDADARRATEYHTRLSEIARIKERFEQDIQNRERQLRDFLGQGKS